VLLGQQVWSSAQPDNVKAMVESMGLLKTVGGGQAPFLVDVWARDSMDLTEETYNAKASRPLFSPDLGSRR